MENKFKHMLQTQEPAVGAWVNFPSPDLFEFLGLAGFDFVVIDTEHYFFNPETILNIIRASRAAGATPILRVRANDPSLILGYLEAGAAGIIVPHVRTAEAARAAVRAVKFSPLGERSVNSITPASRYALDYPVGEVYERANEKTLVITMVEEPEGLANLDAILAVEGLDTVFIGAEDLSAAMGYLGGSSHPDMQATIQRAEAQIRAAGKPVGRLGVSAGAAEQAFADGASFFALFLAGYLGQNLKSFIASTRPR